MAGVTLSDAVTEVCILAALHGIFSQVFLSVRYVIAYAFDKAAECEVTLLLDGIAPDVICTMKTIQPTKTAIVNVEPGTDDFL